MVIVASGMVRGRVRLATTSPQHCGHSHSIELELQQFTVFAEETVWKTFLSALFIAVLEETFSSYKFSSIFGGT